MKQRQIDKGDFLRSIAAFGQVETLIDSLFGCVPGIHYVVKNRKGEFVMMDSAFLQKLEITSADVLLGKNDFDVFPESVAQGYVKDDNMVFESGKPLLNRIEVIPDHRDILEWWSSSKFPLFDSEGKVAGLAAITYKISDEQMPLVKNEAMRGVAEYISKNFRGKITLKELAKAAKMSQRSINRYFNDYFGTTPLKYVNRVRLDAACHELVYTNESIANIAVRCGFFDQSHLAREFRTNFNVTPRNYRLRYFKTKSNLAKLS